MRGTVITGLAVLCGAPALAAGPPPLGPVSGSTVIDVQPDASLVFTTRLTMRIGNAAVAKALAQRAVNYSPSAGDPEFLEAYTDKADGTRLNVQPESIRDEKLPGAPDLVAFSDRRQKVLTFPSVAAGDTISYTVRVHDGQHLLPGAIMISDLMVRTLPWTSYDVTVNTPPGLKLWTETHELDFSRTEDAAGVHYAWHGSVPRPLAQDPAGVAVVDRVPRLFASSLPDWAEAGRAYARLALPGAAVTPRVQALADQITDGVAGRRDQAERLYNWVGRNIRTVPLALVAGTAAPHAADTVLADGYGDSKDQVVLVHALLAAKGIASDMVLINQGEAYTLSDPPTLAQLNHVIIWLPEWELYADTTLSRAPFGVLAFNEYGKPAVHAAADGGVVRSTPLAPPDSTDIAELTDEHIDAEGRVLGTTHIFAHGPFGVALRGYAATVEGQGNERLAAARLHALGTNGAGRFSLGSPASADSDYDMLGTFTLDARPGMLDGDGFRVPAGLVLLVRPGNFLSGGLYPAGAGADAPTPCFSGHEIEQVTLAIPAGRHVAHLPDGTHIQNDHLDFSSVWSLRGDALVMRREFVARFDQPVCTGAVREAAVSVLEQVRRDYQTQVSLAPDTPPAAPR